MEKRPDLIRLFKKEYPGRDCLDSAILCLDSAGDIVRFYDQFVDYIPEVYSHTVSSRECCEELVQCIIREKLNSCPKYEKVFAWLDALPFISRAGISGRILSEYSRRKR